MNIAILGGTVLDPSRSLNEVRDLYIANGKLSDRPVQPIDREIDATGLLVLPGLIDMHCHLRDPGQEYKEDIATGTASAAAGGFTSIACMANTQPVCDNAAVAGYIRAKAERVGAVHVFPIGAVTKNLEGQELAEIGMMAREGIVAISDDGHPVASAEIMKKGMMYASDYGLTVISHCEDPTMKDGAMNEGMLSTKLGLRGIPTAAEEIQVAREITLASYLKLPVHIAHVSSAGSVQLVREAKARGVPVTCETCPHYFTLTEDACSDYNTLAKVNPPLRSEADRQAIIQGLADGTIDAIATDHAPHHEDEKMVEFAQAANGFIGFETALPLALEILVQSGALTLDRLVELMAVNPARILKLDKGTLQEGKDADVLILDPGASWTFDRFATKSKSSNAPYHGRELTGRVCCTIVSGEVAHESLC